MFIIQENLYQLKSSISMAHNLFFSAHDDEEAIQFVHKNHRDAGLTLNRIMLDGSRPKVSLYTSKTWKKLTKER